MDVGKQLQEAIVFCTLISMIASGTYVFYVGISEPNYTHGTFFNTAWIEYGNKHSTIYIEYPYGNLSNMIPAFSEVMRRTYVASWINYKIYDKPIEVVMMTRCPGGTDLREVVRFVLYEDELKHVGHHNTKDYRFATFKKFWDQGKVNEESHQVAIANAETHEITYQTRRWQRDCTTFEQMAADLNSTRMQRLLDTI